MTARVCWVLLMRGAILAGLLATGMGAAYGAQSDYLRPPLRERVEALKRTVQEVPTGRENARERALVLYDWINAFALAGGYVPVNATAVVAQVTAYGAPVYRQIDELIQEFALHDEDPDAIGAFAVDDPGPYQVRSYGEFRQTYTVGNEPIMPGGGFLVASHFQTNHGRYQVLSPDGDNYVSIASSNARARFMPSTYDVAGMHGGFRAAEPQLVFRLDGTTLRIGDTVTIVYGDRAGGGRGLLMPDFSSDRMPFPVYLDLDGANLWYSLPIQPIKIVGGAVRGVHGFAPSIVGANEAFEISVRAEDAYANRATGSVPAWNLLVNGQPYRRLPAGERPIVIVGDIRFPEPGVYRFAIESADGSIRGAANPILVVDDPTMRVFWGETHGHSGFAEGIGTGAEFMRFAREDARLDFVTHSEHDVFMDDHEWDVLKSLVNKYREEGRFAPYLGYEWTVGTRQGGHHNVLFRTPDGRERMPVQLYPTLSRLYQALREHYDSRDIVVIPHAHNKGDYRQSDPELEPLVEILSMHGTFEWFGRMYLNHGHQVGFVAASDDHLSKPGYSIPWRDTLGQKGGLGAVFAPAHSTDNIFDGLKSLRTYATSGDRMVLDFSVNGTPMGQRAPYADQRKIKGRVIGTTPIDNISIFRNDEEIWSRDYYQLNEKLSNDGVLAVSFYSESYPKHPPDNPRGWRHWRGTLTVQNSELTGADLVDLSNRNTQSMAIDPQQPNIIRFSTNTRGDYSSLTLRLKNVDSRTRLVLQLEDTVETGSAPPLLRPHQRIPGGEVVISLAQMDQGRLEQNMAFDGYKDRIDVRLVNPRAADDVAFEFDDSAGVEHGDYYFVRVRQTNDAMAWSSPVWVGGYPPR